MGAGAEVMKEYLVLLGFQVDEAGKAKFASWLSQSARRVGAFYGGIEAAAGLLYTGIYKIAEHNAELLNTAEALGMTVGKLRELNFLAGLTGSSADALQASLRGVQQAMAGATIGQGGLVPFARLGIRIKDANGHLRETSDVLMDVGQKIKKMDRPRAEMFLGQLGIDRSLYKMLTQDVTGLTQAYREMYAATGMNAQEAAEKSRGFVQEVKLLKAVFGLLGETINLALIDKGGKDVTAFRKQLLANFAQIVQVLLVFIQLLLRVAGFFGTMTMRIVKWVGSLVRWFGSLDSSTQTLILSVLGFAAAWKFLNLSFLATPLGRLFALGLVIAALIDDFQTWQEGGESLINWGSDFTKVIVGVTGVVGLLVAGMAVVPGIISAVVTAGTILTAGIEGITTAIRIMSAAAAANPLMAFFLAAALVASLIIANWETVKAWFQSFVDWLSDKFSWVLTAARAAARIMGSGQGGSAPALGPSPAFAANASAAVAGGQKIELNATAHINVDGSDDPETVGRRVLSGQQRVNADFVRNMRGAAS